MTSTTQTPASVNVITDFPMPPTHNRSYIPVRVGGHARLASSPELKRYRSEVYAWALLNRRTVQRLMVDLPKMGALRVNAKFYFEYSKIYTKEGNPKSLDTSNRFKALHDEISKLVGVDDKWFFEVSGSKVVGPTDCVTVTFSKVSDGD